MKTWKRMRKRMGRKRKNRRRKRSKRWSGAPHRFGSLLELAEHAFDVLEVGGEGGVVEGEVPLPGGTALRTHTRTQFQKLLPQSE